VWPTVVPLDNTHTVLLVTSWLRGRFSPHRYLRERAFADEMASRGRLFSVTDDPRQVFEKTVIWFTDDDVVSPPLWDYSRQVFEFALGLERQGNKPFCSSYEVAFWENKAYMHRRLDEAGIATPRTTIITGQSTGAIDFEMEPVVIKQEHSAGSVGISYLATATEAREFVRTYRFRPTESLIMQEVVSGATRDLRVTMAGDTMVENATYWRTKSQQALSAPEWTTTATSHGSIVDYENIPEYVGPLVADWLRQLGIRTAGVDMMWVDDDVTRQPLLLELSPYYQPNPPKPKRYEKLSYKEFKKHPFRSDGYFSHQHSVTREIAGHLLDQGLI
jgi:glutathione synthase/RimK-type ligase-like ATP-grasp enzyme